MKFNTVLFVNATIGFSENLFLVFIIFFIINITTAILFMISQAITSNNVDHRTVHAYDQQLLCYFALEFNAYTDVSTLTCN